MKRLARTILGVALSCALFSNTASAQSSADIKPSPQQSHWQDL